MIDVALLTNPIPGGDPCGPDLDAEGDDDYLNFFASVDAVFPASFFEVKDGDGNIRRFDPKVHNLSAKIESANGFAARTHDLRLIVNMAKLSILDRDLLGFKTCVEAIAKLLAQQWEAVHPRADGEDVSYRQMAIEALDVMPTVVIPLQVLPLVENRRLGAVSYRTWLLAKGELTPRADDTILDAAAIAQVFDQIDLDQLKAVTATYVGLSALLETISRTWVEKATSSTPINLDRVQQVVSAISALLEGQVKRRDPTALEAPSDTVVSEEGAADAQAATARITSVAAAAAALSGVAAYFGRMEPSSPALLLVRQAEQLLGKSFAEAIHILVPSHAETAAINVGRDWVFDVSVDRMAALASPYGPVEPNASDGPEPTYAVTSRAEALRLLEQISAFFRNVEPSSPVPFLADRARELAQRDFLSLLLDVLPSGSLRSPGNQT
jgi:type VI secretion system protein ImpA